MVSTLYCYIRWYSICNLKLVSHSIFVLFIAILYTHSFSYTYNHMIICMLENFTADSNMKIFSYYKSLSLFGRPLKRVDARAVSLFEPFCYNGCVLVPQDSLLFHSRLISNINLPILNFLYLSFYWIVYFDFSIIFM